MSIARTQFAKLAAACPIHVVDTVEETRHKRLEYLISQYGSIAALNQALGLERTHAVLSQIRTRAPHSKSGKPRVMGSDKAREIEEKLGLPRGWMDTPELGQYVVVNQRINRAVQLLSAMEPGQLDQALRVLDTLAQPVKREGTHDQ